MFKDLTSVLLNQNQKTEGEGKFPNPFSAVRVTSDTTPAGRERSMTFLPVGVSPSSPCGLHGPLIGRGRERGEACDGSADGSPGSCSSLFWHRVDEAVALPCSSLLRKQF